MLGKQESLAMRARRLASKLKKDNPELASAIQEATGNNNYLRGAVTHKAPLPVDSDSRQNLLIETFPVILDAEPIWGDEIHSKLNRFTRERLHASELLDEGLLPAKSMLLEGPPGVGKTLAAKWLAAKLNLPLLTLDLATVMSSFLGKTGNNIKSVLNYARSFPCVLLLDEFDSIAKKRDDDSDVGELKRLVTVLLQSIDEWPPSSIMVAATNHGELLDPAVWRRFDKVIHFEHPSAETINAYLKTKNIPTLLSNIICKSATGLSFAIIERKLIQAKKNTILEQLSLIKALFDEFDVTEEDLNDNDKLLREFSILNLTIAGYSQRRISEELEISRTVVKSTLLKSEEGPENEK